MAHYTTKQVLLSEYSIKILRSKNIL